jgi:hypothetical protein
MDKYAISFGLVYADGTQTFRKIPWHEDIQRKVTVTEFYEIQDGGSRQVLRIEISTVSTDDIKLKLPLLVIINGNYVVQYRYLKVPPIQYDISKIRYAVCRCRYDTDISISAI